MKKIDMEAWERREVFDFFSGLKNPFFSVTFNVDVTNLYKFCKGRGLSFYYALTYLVTQAVNSVPAFRICAVDGALYEIDRRIPSFTDMKKGSELFHIVTMPCEGGIEDFCRAAKEKSAEQDRFICHEKEGDELIYISCLPWLELTSLTNEGNFDENDSIPRISWGKFCERDGRKILGMSVEVNHRFQDGVHVGAFAQKLESLIEEL